MADSSKARIQIETGRTVTDYTAMTDSSDHQVYTVSGGTLWSGYSESGTDYGPDVRPNGIVSGVNIGSVHADDDKVTISAFTCYSKGTLQEVSATTATFSRATSSTVSSVTSVTMASDGSIATVKGTEGASTAFSETRGAAGGPPLIPVNSVELFQIRTTASTAAAVTASEIYQVVGTHTERYDYPGWTENNVGDGAYAEESAKQNAYIEFDSALPAIHTGTVTKAIYIKWYTPQLANLGRTIDFVPADNTHSSNSEEYYGGTVSSTSSSLGQCSFTVFGTDGIGDNVMSLRDYVVTAKFFPDRNKSAYILTQGKLGTSRSFPNSAQNKINCTLTPEVPSANFIS